MSNICQITGKKSISGNRRSHAMNTNKRKFYSNIHSHIFWIPNKNKFIKIYVSSKGIRIINKLGIENILNVK